MLSTRKGSVESKPSKDYKERLSRAESVEILLILFTKKGSAEIENVESLRYVFYKARNGIRGKTKVCYRLGNVHLSRNRG